MGDYTAPRIHSPQYYERLAALEDAHPWTEAMRQTGFALLERFGLNAGSPRLLDAGCGTGLFLHELEDRLQPCSAVGCDASLDGLRRAKHRGLVRLTAARLDALPYRDECPDAITCFDVLQHLRLDEARRAVQEFRRVLKSGGVLVVRAAARRGWGKKRHQDSGDYQQWEPAKLRRLLEECGFQVVFLALANCLPSIWADLQGFASSRALRGDEGLSLTPLSRRSVKGRVLARYWSIERHWILGHGVRPPLGHTVFCVGKKG